MPGRQSRQKGSDSLRANRARCVLTSSPTRQARSRSRSEVSLSDSPDGWTVTRLRTDQKYIGIDSPKYTPKSSMLKIFQQFAKQGCCPAKPRKQPGTRSSEPRLEWSQIRQRTTLRKRTRIVLRTLIQLGTK